MKAESFAYSSHIARQFQGLHHRLRDVEATDQQEAMEYWFVSGLVGERHENGQSILDRCSSHCGRYCPVRLVRHWRNRWDG